VKNIIEKNIILAEDVRIPARGAHPAERFTF
jgi:hypothetical protein